MSAFLFIINILIAVGIFYFLPGELGKKSIAIYLCQIPVWALYSLKAMPKHQEGWKQKLPFVIALGFGLSILFFVISLVLITFLVAITGMTFSKVYIYLFVPAHLLAIFLGYTFQSREISRLTHWGMDYSDHIQSSVPEDDVTTQGMGETLAMLTLLDLPPDLTKEDLKKRYHELSQLYHPDRLTQMGDKEKAVAEREFKRFKRAYELVKAQMEAGKL